MSTVIDRHAAAVCREAFCCGTNGSLAFLSDPDGKEARRLDGNGVKCSGGFFDA